MTDEDRDAAYRLCAHLYGGACRCQLHHGRPCEVVTDMIAIEKEPTDEADRNL